MIWQERDEPFDNKPLNDKKEEEKSVLIIAISVYVSFGRNGQQFRICTYIMYLT